jgi:hypothetical protein
MAVEIVWTWQRVGQTENAQTILTCGSRLTGDRALNTVANAMIKALRGLIPPWVETQFLPDGTAPDVVIAAHRRAIADRNDVVPVPRSDWLASCLKSAQRGFDHLVAVKMLIPISQADVQRLRAVDVEPVVQAELVR